MPETTLGIGVMEDLVLEVPAITGYGASHSRIGISDELGFTTPQTPGGPGDVADTEIGVRVVTDAVVTIASSTVTSASFGLLSAARGAQILGAGIPDGTYIGIVNAANSIGLSSSASQNIPVLATASGSPVTLRVTSANRCWLGMVASYPQRSGTTMLWQVTAGPLIGNHAWNGWGLDNGLIVGGLGNSPQAPNPGTAGPAGILFNHKVVSGLGTKEAGEVWTFIASLSQT